jgi:hypothetical protein
MTEWDKPTLTIKQAAAIAGVAEHTMAAATRAPDFPCRKFGRRTVISTEGFRNWLANGWRTPSGTITATR